jgi:hypothetical protein
MRASRPAPLILCYMPPLLPREIQWAVPVVWAHRWQPSHIDHRVGISTISDEATCRFACATACNAVFEYSRPLIAQTPHPNTGEVNG